METVTLPQVHKSGLAVNDHQGQRRVMHRILLAGPKPTPASVTS
jgi:hypothetical protein